MRQIPTDPTRRALLLGGLALATLPAPVLGQATLNVVATTGMIADTARVIGGGRVTVRALMGPGVDPHAYRQTRSDIAAMAGAGLVLWHGLYLEAQMEDFLGDLAASRQVVAVAESVPADLLLAHDDYPDRFDPHVWMDPALWVHVIGAVRDALIAADPAGAEVFAANARALEAEAAALGAYAAQVLGSVPQAARVLVTAHDAFRYFGRAWGYEVVGLQGISTESEAGVARVSALVDLLVGRQIGAVFVESSVSDRGLRALIEGAAAQGHAVTIGGELFSDAMGPEGSYEGTWLGMIDHNVTTVARALGGTVPPGGRQGRLAS
jgi:manganese/zinc/iron transport system substrate-binding protein